MPILEEIEQIQERLNNALLSAITIFGVGNYEWGNAEGYPIRGDSDTISFHRCQDGFVSSDIRYNGATSVYCGRCDKSLGG